MSKHNTEDGPLWQSRRLVAQQHTPIGHPDRQNSEYNVQVEWENGEITSEPLSFLAKDISVDLAIYARDNNLLDLTGWKRFKRLASRNKQLQRLVRQAKLRSFRTSPRYKYGFQIPNNHEHALELDRRAGNTKWSDANNLEHSQLREYAVFIDKGKFHESKIPRGYRKIRVQTIYDIKHDGRHKVRIVARGDLTPTPTESV